MELEGLLLVAMQVVLYFSVRGKNKHPIFHKPV